MKILLTVLLFFIVISTNAQLDYVPGYEKAIAGETISYHSPQQAKYDALVVRSKSAAKFIEWETAIVPEKYKGEFVIFKLMMAIDVNPEDPHSWDIQINNNKIFTIATPKDTMKKTIQIRGVGNSLFSFETSEVDRYGDLLGFLTLKIPSSLVKKGKAAKIKIQGESAGSNTWFIIYKYKTVPACYIQQENAIHKGKGFNERIVKLRIYYYKKGRKADIKLGDHNSIISIKCGYNECIMFFVDDKAEKTLPYSVSVDGEILDKGTITLKPVKPMTIHFLHHSHVDIGYTHLQNEVEEKQWNYIEECIELAENSQNYPKEAQFKWNIEVMWALDSYWRKADTEKKERLKKAIQKSWIELDAFFGNELTGLCTSEELMHLMSSAKEIANECGVELNSAMISDIPGWSWGIVTALCQNNIKYLSLGTNTFHRIGYTLEEWGDKPFYWQSASGKDKILSWIHGKGYSVFHTGLEKKNAINKKNEEIILSYMNELRDKQYPYDIAILRYSIGSDNGPPDNQLSRKIKDWNEKYEIPKLVISTTSEAFSIFEQAYGETLPIVEGDFTGYWEDGAASSAKETALNRWSAHAISQAQTLMAINNIDSPAQQFNRAWQKVILYNEHTWGSWNSISDPNSDFTKQQWAVKQAYAIDAQKIAYELKEKALKNRYLKDSDYYEVINTHSWPVNDIITIPASQAKGFCSVEDEKGNQVTSQKLKDGSLIFISDDIPAFSSKIFKLSKSEHQKKEIFSYGGNTIENEKIKITLGKRSATIKKLLWKEKNINLVSDGVFSGLNEYIYIEGRKPENQKKAKDPEIRIKESGPILVSINAAYKDAEGCNSLSSTYKIYNEPDRIDIVNELDKKPIYYQEGVHFAFPFNIPEGLFYYDLAYGFCQLNKNQIDGSNKNFIIIENWVDISNNNYGITWISKDAPLIEAGDIFNDPVEKGYLKKIPETQTVISYVMNNYWETNYRAAQSGYVQFNYSIYPHMGFNPSFSEKRALEIQEPLVVIPVKKGIKPLSFNLSLINENLIIQSIVPYKEKGQYRLRIFNAGDKPECLKWKETPKELYSWDIRAENRKKLKTNLELVPMELISVLVIN